MSEIAEKPLLEVNQQVTESISTKVSGGHALLKTFAPQWLDFDRMNESPEYRRALLRVLLVQVFYLHAVIYAIVNALLLVIDLLTGSYYWFYWVLMGWGIGLAAHAGLLWGLPKASAWQAELIDKELARGAH